MKRLVLLLAIVSVYLVGMVGVSRAADPAEQSILTQLQAIQQQLNSLQATVNAGAPVKPKRYYLTDGEFKGDQALTACTSGFHMASLFEILDPSQLKYDSAIPASLYDPTSDQGAGPPTFASGWIRTGYASHSSVDPGLANCNVWSSNGETSWGTIGIINPNFGATLGPNPSPTPLHNCSRTVVYCWHKFLQHPLESLVCRRPVKFPFVDRTSVSYGAPPHHNSSQQRT